MEAYRADAIVQPDGKVTLDKVPFPAGQNVEVIVLSHLQPASSTSSYPLRGTPITYLDPTEPVSEQDWDAAS